MDSEIPRLRSGTPCRGIATIAVFGHVADGNSPISGSVVKLSEIAAKTWGNDLVSPFQTLEVWQSVNFQAKQAGVAVRPNFWSCRQQGWFAIQVLSRGHSFAWHSLYQYSFLLNVPHCIWRKNYCGTSGSMNHLESPRIISVRFETWFHFMLPTCPTSFIFFAQLYSLFASIDSCWNGQSCLGPGVGLFNPQHQRTAGDEVLASWAENFGIPSFATMCKWITSKYVVFSLSICMLQGAPTVTL